MSTTSDDHGRRADACDDVSTRDKERQMSTRLVATAVAAIAVSVLWVSAAQAAPAATASKNVTFHLVEKDVAFNFVDNPPRQGFRAPPSSGTGSRSLLSCRRNPVRTRDGSKQPARSPVAAGALKAHATASLL